MHNALCLLIEDQQSTIEFLEKALVAAFPGVVVVVARSLREAQAWLAQRATETSKPRLAMALVDVGLPDGSGVDIVRQLTRDEPETLSIVLTIHGDDSYLFDSLAAGAYGYLLKDDEPHLLIDMLKRVDRQEPPLSPSIARRLLAHFREPRVVAPQAAVELTARERETLTLLARGLTVPEAAVRMGLSAQTVAGYVKIVYQKLHVSNRAQATREAIRLGLA